MDDVPNLPYRSGCHARGASSPSPPPPARCASRLFQKSREAKSRDMPAREFVLASVVTPLRLFQHPHPLSGFVSDRPSAIKSWWRRLETLKSSQFLLCPPPSLQFLFQVWTSQIVGNRISIACTLLLGQARHYVTGAKRTHKCRLPLERSWRAMSSAAQSSILASDQIQQGPNAQSSRETGPTRP